MESNIKVNFKYSGISNAEILKYAEKVKKIHNILNQNIEKKQNFTGWITWPCSYDKKEFEKIKKIANKVKKDSQVLIVIGIGGSYLGARAVIESLTNKFKRDDSVEILYVGNNLNANYINEIIDYVSDKDISINVISKSGKTTEPAIAFRIFRNLMENKYGIDGARKRIFVTTTKRKGALYKIAMQEKYVKLSIPENIGGRYSVLTPVGLLPMAVAGIDIDSIMEGAKLAQEKYNEENLKYNDCYKYAVVRNILYDDGKTVELLGTYEPKLSYFIEWWKQLFGESEGKEQKGIFPAGVDAHVIALLYSAKLRADTCAHRAINIVVAHFFILLHTLPDAGCERSPPATIARPSRHQCLYRPSAFHRSPHCLCDTLRERSPEYGR